nr:secretin N-terminal domain-containing protein [uncultured Deefgea sp.]
MRKLVLGIGSVVWVATGCSTSSGLTPLSTAHIAAPPKNEAPVVAIPPLARPIPTLAKPIASPKLETYSVVVSQLDVHDLLFALARDARINVDVSPGVTGVVTLNAINQTLPQILDRIARQVDLRWSMENGVLNITPDSPVVRIYHVDYFNLSRNMKSTLNILNSVKSAAEDSGGSGSNGSTSFSSIDSESQNQFWKRLETNLKEILDVKAGSVAATTALNTAKIAQLGQQATQKVATQSTDASTALSVVDKAAKIDKTLAQTEKVQAETVALQTRASPETKPVDANYVVINPETGTITIRASSKAQSKVAEFLASIQASAQRQVLIEATIVEVVLSDQYQAGVDWSQIANGAGWTFGQSLIGANLSSAPLSLISYKSTNFNATVKLLEQFGKTRVLSSPKITALNNQPAVMKVVEELVYFTMNVTQSTSDTNGIITPPTYESVLRTVPVGLVMQVTPQISASGMISMSIHPTITNVSGYVEDPAVAIIAAQTGTNLKSVVPELQVREFDSTLKIASGEVAVLGGLIQDKQSNQRQGVPGLSRLPWLGDAFSYRDDKVRKIELVVFLRPMVVKENGQDDRLGGLRSYLPSDEFFNSPQDQDLSAFQSGVIPFPSKAGVPQ